MCGACTALAVEDVLPRILVLMPVSGQDLSALFDVASSTQKCHWCCMCILFTFYGHDFEIRVPVCIAARVVGELSQPFHHNVYLKVLPKVLVELVL